VDFVVVYQSFACGIGAPFSTIKIYKESSRCIMVKTTKSTVKHRKKLIFSWEIQEEHLG